MPSLVAAPTLLVYNWQEEVQKEKIYVQQQKKQELIDALIKPGENFLNKMNEDEIRELFTL